jgi:hypothetical protein
VLCFQKQTLTREMACNWRCGGVGKTAPTTAPACIYAYISSLDLETSRRIACRRVKKCARTRLKLCSLFKFVDNYAKRKRVILCEFHEQTSAKQQNTNALFVSTQSPQVWISDWWLVIRAKHPHTSCVWGKYW